MTTIYRKMDGKHSIFLLISLILMLGVGTAFAGDTIKIGVVGPFTGPAANIGLEQKDGLELCFKEVNDAGGIFVDGAKKKIEVFYEDCQSKIEIGVAAAQKLLTREKVDILMADMVHSSITLAIQELAPSYRDVFFLGGGVVYEVALKVKKNPERYRNFFKLNFSSDGYAHSAFGAITDLVKAGKIPTTNKKMVYIVEDTDYGRSNVDFMKPMFEGAGWETAKVEMLPVGYTDFYPQLTAIRGIKPDVLITVFSSAASGIAIVKQLAEQEIQLLHLGIPYCYGPEYNAEVGAAGYGMLECPVQFDPQNNPKHKAFKAELLTRLPKGRPATQEVAVTMDFTKTMLKAIEMAKSVKAEALVKAYEQVDYQGVTGRWVYDDYHRPKLGAGYVALGVSQNVKGNHMVVWPPSAAVTEYQWPY